MKVMNDIEALECHVHNIQGLQDQRNIKSRLENLKVLLKDSVLLSKEASSGRWIQM
jgi:hypothetical protein